MWRREEELEEMFNIYSSRKKNPARSHGASRKLVIHILCVLESCLGSATITAGPVDEEKKGKKARGIIEFQISFFFPFPSCDLYFSLVLTGKMMDFDGWILFCYFRIRQSGRRDGKRERCRQRRTDDSGRHRAGRGRCRRPGADVRHHILFQVGAEDPRQERGRSGRRRRRPSSTSSPTPTRNQGS